MRRIFVSGTDTDVGKTLVSAGILLGWSRRGPVRYWKPVQSGCASGDDDTTTVRALTGLPAPCFLEPVYRLGAPLSPHLAAELDGVRIDPVALWDRARLALASEEGLVVEGAGGLLVPLADNLLLIDMVAKLELPVLLVVRDRLGAINHTLLSIEACRRRSISIAGVVLNAGEGIEGNRESIERFGDVKVWQRYPRFETPDRLVSSVARDIDETIGF